MTWFRRIFFGLLVASLYGLTTLTASAAVGATLTMGAPGHGRGGASFTATYKITGFSNCGSQASTVELHWNSASGNVVGSAPISSCTVQVGGTAPGNATTGSHTVYAVRVKGGSVQTSPPPVSAQFNVDAPPPPPPPTPPPPTNNPGPQPTSTSTTQATTTTNPAPGPVAAATDPGSTPAPAPTGDQPAAASAVPAAPTAAATCKGTGCARPRTVAITPSLVDRVQSVVGKSPFWLIGVVLVAVVMILFFVMRRSQAARPVAAAAVVRPAPLDPTTLDPVDADPENREIYVPPVPEPLPRGDETVELKRPGRRAPVRPTKANMVALMVDAPAAAAAVEAPAPVAKRAPRGAVPAPAAQDTEAILPHELFPSNGDETVVIKPQPGDDGLPAMAPPPPK